MSIILPLVVAIILAVSPAWASEDADHADASSDQPSVTEHQDAHDEAHAGAEDRHEHGDHAEGEHREDHAEGEDSDHVAEAHGIRLLHGWTNATGDAETLIYVEITNQSDAEVTLTGAASEIADSAELIGLAVRDGALRFDTLPGVPVAPGRELALSPDGLAIRLSGLEEPLEEGDTVEVTLNFDVGDVAMTVAVEDANARQHSHAGHQH